MTRICCISDTHGYHEQVEVPACDIVIHAGDCSRGGTESATEFLDWFASLPCPHKVLVAGNHDMVFEKAPSWAINVCRHRGITYLKDSGAEVLGLRFWGSPVTPRFFDWAFNRDRGEKIRAHWDLIPEGTDVLVTHGPAHLTRDANYAGARVGCVDLLDALKRVKPRLHACGHIHPGYGECEVGPTRVVNASVCNEAYKPVNKPILVEL